MNDTTTIKFNRPLECEDLQGKQVYITEAERQPYNVNFLLTADDKQLYNDLELHLLDADDLIQFNTDIDEETRDLLIHCLT